MKPARLAVLAALAVLVVAVVAWVAGPVDVAEPRFDIDATIRPFEPEPADGDPGVPGCEENGPGCLDVPGPASEGSVGSLVAIVLLFTVLVWRAAKVVRRLARRLAEARMSVVEDETIGAQIREALRDASQQAAANVGAASSGEVTDSVVACWVLLERTAERVGTPRASAATPTEFAVDLLHAHDADPRVVATLLELYHEARFGTSPLPASASGTAAEALRRIAESLSGAGTTEEAS